MPEGLPRREEERLRRHTFWPSSRIFLVAHTSNEAMELTSKIKPSSYDNTTFNLPFLTRAIVLTYEKVNINIMQNNWVTNPVFTPLCMLAFSLAPYNRTSDQIHILQTLEPMTTAKKTQHYDHLILSGLATALTRNMGYGTKESGKVTIPISTTFSAYSFYKYIQYLLWTRHCTGLWACNGEQTQYSPPPPPSLQLRHSSWL